jgi:hemolysin-activating ACP:hemolysin acyltransferase
LIAPFGGADEIMKGLCEKVFPGQSIKSFLPTEDGKGLRVVELGDAGTTDEEETQEGDGD